MQQNTFQYFLVVSLPKRYIISHTLKVIINIVAAYTAQLIIHGGTGSLKSAGISLLQSTKSTTAQNFTSDDLWRCLFFINTHSHCDCCPGSLLVVPPSISFQSMHRLTQNYLIIVKQPVKDILHLIAWGLSFLMTSKHRNIQNMLEFIPCSLLNKLQLNVSPQMNFGNIYKDMFFIHIYTHGPHMWC